MEPNRDLRVEWAEERTALAIARTLASWIRTGLGMIGVALGMHFVFRSAASLILGRLAASLFLAIAIALFIGGQVQARRLQDRLAEEHELPIRPAYGWLTAALVVATLMVGVTLWRI